MYRNTIFGQFFLLLINSYFLGSLGHRVYLRYLVQPEISDAYEGSSETDFSQNLPESNNTGTTENDSLFWTMSNTEETVEADSEIQTDVEKLDNVSENTNSTFQLPESGTEEETNVTTIITNPPQQIQDVHKVEEDENNSVTHSDVPDSVMDEKILLQRSNCHLEIAVQETLNLKTQIVFGTLQNNTSGKCCITLIGEKHSRLGVLISNIYLYQNASDGEVLKVITADYGINFVLKEYYSWTNYQPMVLTETDKVYIVLYYKVASVPSNEQNSHFNLEVFSYYKSENYVHYGNSHSESHFSHKSDVENFPVKEPSFIPYF